MTLLTYDLTNLTEIQRGIRRGAVVLLGRIDGRGVPSTPKELAAREVFVRVLRVWRWRGPVVPVPVGGWIRPGDVCRIEVAMPGGVALVIRARSRRRVWGVSGVMVPAPSPPGG